MKKALEQLKKEYPLICDMSFEWGWKSCEEVIKPKTCGECEYLDGVICRHDRGLYCVRQFEADYYEPKDNA